MENCGNCLEWHPSGSSVRGDKTKPNQNKTNKKNTHQILIFSQLILSQVSLISQMKIIHHDYLKHQEVCSI